MVNELNLLSWPDYISPATVEQFQKEFQVAVRVHSVAGAVEMMGKLHQATPPDVLCPPEYLVPDLSAEGLLLELDYSRLPNLKHLEPQFRQGRPHDPLGRVSVIKDWGTTGFMFRTDLVSESPQTWEHFWDLSEKYSGRVTMLDSPGEVIGAALKKNGLSYNACDEPALALAGQDLLQITPHLFSFETNYRPLLSSGQISMALGWNGDAAALFANGVPVRYVVPLEGSQIWEDDWAISKSTLIPEIAHTFINFVLRPEVAAQEAQYTRYATGNGTGRALLDEAMRNDPATYPPQEVMDKLERGLPLNAEDSQRRAALWAEVRA